MAHCHTCSQIWPTHLSEDTPLCLIPSHSAVMPSVVNVPKPLRSIPQSWLSSKLPGTNNERFQECDRARCHTPQQAWAIWARTTLLAHLREHKLGISFIAAMSAYSPSMLEQMLLFATLRTE
jgi:hypothetical protein